MMMKFSIFLFFLVYVLNPYTVVGPLGYFIIPMVIIPFLYRFKYSYRMFLSGSLILVFISVVGVLSSLYHDVFQFTHLKVSFSIIIYLLFGMAIFYISLRSSVSFNDLVWYGLLVIFLNSIIVLLEVSFPVVRASIESLLGQSGNIDWTQGFRYRGIASGGGASLSLLIPIGVAMSFHLYLEKYLRIPTLLVYLGVIVTAGLFVGRTGLVLVPVVALLFVALNFRRFFPQTLILTISVFLVVFIFGDLIYRFLIDKYGAEFFEYSLGFALKGMEGFENEGTVSVLLEFLTVVPKTFPEVLIGYGFYGEGRFEPWTDSGYSRMLLSVGYLFGVLFYVTFLLMFSPLSSSRRFLFLSMAAVLLIAEVKEPLLFTGYAARLYIILAVISTMFDRAAKSENDIEMERIM